MSNAGRRMRRHAEEGHAIEVLGSVHAHISRLKRASYTRTLTYRRGKSKKVLIIDHETSENLSIRWLLCTHLTIREEYEGQELRIWCLLLLTSQPTACRHTAHRSGRNHINPPAKSGPGGPQTPEQLSCRSRRRRCQDKIVIDIE